MITNLKRIKLESSQGPSGVVNMKEQVDDNNNDSGDGTENTRCQAPVSTLASGPGGCAGKYQLRPRALQVHRRVDSDWIFQDSLRHKSRPPPLSRYRRKTANARERYRMRQINRAFESLRGILPAWVCSRRAAADMTKITTLRLASAYIRSLQDILEGGETQDSSWVLSSILADAADATPEISSQQPLQEEDSNGQHSAHINLQDTDLVTLFCNTTDDSVLQDNLEFSCLAPPMSESEAVALLLGGPDPPRPWQDHHHTQLVTS